MNNCLVTRETYLFAKLDFALIEGYLADILYRVIPVAVGRFEKAAAYTDRHSSRALAGAVDHQDRVEAGV